MIATKLPVIPLTPAGLAQFQTELATLEHRRPEILTRLQAAREMGDLSENGAYKAARFELGDIDRRIRQLTYLTRFGVATPKAKPGTIGFGSEFTLSTGSASFTYTLVSAYESDPTVHKLSDQSPLGQLLIGHHAGDQVTLQAPAGTTTYTVISVN